jgi:outer membrane protein assembly factor BamB
MRHGWIAGVAAALAAAGVLLSASPPEARMADWLTDGGDAHRTAWQQHETALAPATVKNMTRLWTIRLDNAPRQMHALFPALIAGRVDTSAGPKQIAVVAGSSNTLYGIDVEAGALVWQRHFDRGFSPPLNGRPPSTLCPGGLTATPVIAPASAPARYVVYAISWDGSLRTLDVATGEETLPPAKFLPPNGKPYALNLWNGVIYTATAERCGDNVDAVYAFDLATKRVARFAPNGGGLWGRAGPSIGGDGTVYTPTGDGTFNPSQRLYGQAIIALTRQPATGTLTLKDYFAPPNAAWMTERDLDMNVTGPVFTAGGRELMAQSSKECRLWLLDTGALGGADHRTAAYASPVLCNEKADWESAGVWGAMAAWVDAAGMRWLATPFWGPKAASFTAPVEHGEVTHGAVAAFTVADQNGSPALVPRWISRDMNRADPPVVANGVVFGYGAGESTTQRWDTNGQRIDPTLGRISQSTHAVIYALDAASGAELWSSGDAITSWNHFSGLSVANGRVYIGTYDGNLYCFGLKGAPVTGRRPSSR